MMLQNALLHARSKQPLAVTDGQDSMVELSD